MPLLTKESVSWFDYESAGAMTNDNFDKLHDVLKYCLIDGGTNKSIVSVAINGPDIEIECTAHGFYEAQVVIISGANEAAWNGRRKISIIDADHFSYTLENGEEPDPTGTLEVRLAPVGGWEISDYTANTTFILRSIDSNALGHCIRFNRLETQYAGVRMYFSLSDAQTETNGSPERYIPHWNNGSKHHWELYADPLFFAMINGINESAGGHHFSFGDFVKIRGADQHYTFLGARDRTNFLGAISSSWSYPFYNFFEQATIGGNVISTIDQATSFPAAYSQHFGGGRIGASEPGYTGYFLNAGLVYICNSVDGLRGIYPGAYAPGTAINNGLLPRQLILDSNNRLFRITPRFNQSNTTISNPAYHLVDLIGPWR